MMQWECKERLLKRGVGRDPHAAALPAKRKDRWCDLFPVSAAGQIDQKGIE